MTKKDKRIFIIDSSSFIFRAFFAIPRLSTSKGIPTNAVFGFVTMLLKVIEKYKPDYVACVFDSKAPSFRKEIYDDYKANRGEPPDDLKPQFELVDKAIESLKFPKIAIPGFEADDIIATLVERFKDYKVTIVSSDKDLMQLVTDDVEMLDTMKDIHFGPSEVKDKLGVGPEHVTDFLGLTGDASDNIPGVRGIGPKTAVGLISEYGSLEKIYENLPSMKSSRKKELLETYEKEAKLSKKLATVLKNVKVDVNLEDLNAPHTVPKSFVDFASDLEFHTLVKKYSNVVSSTQNAPSSSVSLGYEFRVQTVTEEKQFSQMLDTISKKSSVAFDTETMIKKSGSSQNENRIRGVQTVGISLSNGEQTWYVPIRHKQGLQLNSDLVFEKLMPVLSSKELIAQNIKYDYRVLLAEGFDLDFEHKNSKSFDTMLAHYLIEPEEKHGLDFLAKKYLDMTIGQYDALVEKGQDFSDVPIEKAALYSGMDAFSTWHLKSTFEKDLKSQGLLSLFHEIEMPVAFVLAHMEWNGVKIDSKILNDLSEEYAKELKTIEEDIFSIVGHAFNLNSPKQLSDVLFNKLGLPVVQKTKTGFSTDVFVMEKLAGQHPVPGMIVRYRELTKLKSTYVDVLPNLVENDGRVHANFNQAVTATGRLSSSDPNLQNIPIKSESGRKIRKAFVSETDSILVGADYSQIELRLVAHLSQDKSLLKAFAEGKDIHRATAAEVFNVKEQDVSDMQRGAAKAINFGLIYGKTAFGLAQELKISRHEAQAYIDAYFKRYSGVKEFMQKCLDDARKNGYAVTLFGRKRPIRDLDNRNVGVRNNAERMALNTPMQGTGADLMKIAMVRVHSKIKSLGAKVVLQVHDELVLETKNSNKDEIENILVTEMQGAAKLDVKLEAKAAIANSWYDL
ncbi:MAG: DNA polymerase I [Bacteriovoracia bacterium]